MPFYGCVSVSQTHSSTGALQGTVLLFISFIFTQNSSLDVMFSGFSSLFSWFVLFFSSPLPSVNFISCFTLKVCLLLAVFYFTSSVDLLDLTSSLLVRLLIVLLIYPCSWLLVSFVFPALLSLLFCGFLKLSFCSCFVIIKELSLDVSRTPAFGS